MFRIFALLCLARACSAATAIIDGKEVDCFTDCSCCKGGSARCGDHSVHGNLYCLDGCIATITGNKCRNNCRGNCYECQHNYGTPCYQCKDTFYDLNSQCNKSCSVGCSNGTCNNDGTCRPCTATFEGIRCDVCKPGKYDKSTLCKKVCSTGCQNACFDDGTCSCRLGFTGPSCTECIPGHYGTECRECPSGCSRESCMTNGTCYQCDSGYFGDFCNKTCSIGCRNSICNMRNGICNECNSEYYGEQCETECSSGCKSGVCHIDGTCTCKDKFTGTYCDVCVAGKYGDECQQDCSLGCSSSTCGRNNGSCECLQNFIGDKCETCINGRYGRFCDLQCLDKCANGICSRFNGSCTHGCSVGYSGSNCTNQCDAKCEKCNQYDESVCTSCSNGYSGPSCSCPPNCICHGNSNQCIGCTNPWINEGYECKCKTEYCSTYIDCSTCLNNTFFVESSMPVCCDCPQNCKGGFCLKGPRCTLGCEDGFYGMDCSFKCSDFNAECLQCSRDAGMCLLCREGFYPNENGNCISCNENCKNQQCNSETGKCSKGCVGPYWGDKCEIQCSSNCETCQQASGICYSCTYLTVFGPYCNESCSSKCIDRQCTQKNGHCSFGCETDFFGNLCEAKCPENCVQRGSKTRCNTDGHCKYGCIDGFEEADCTVPAKVVQANTAIKAIVGGVSGGVLVMIGVVVAIFFLRRSSIRMPSSNKGNGNGNAANERTYYNDEQTKRETTEPNYTGSWSSSNKPTSIKQQNAANLVSASENGIERKLDDESDRALGNYSKDDQTYCNELGASTSMSKIPIGQLVKFVDDKAHEEFSAEFEKFPYGLVKPYVESQKKENISKNRYKGIYPYDDSRVKVRGSGGSDYINASFIDGYKKPKQYIATLGPMSQQLGDFSLFWKMIWQQRVEKIVMVTNLIEQGAPKCEQYWPKPCTTRKYGDIKVESCSEDEYAEFTRRVFTVTMGSEERTLHHLHFTCWPDKAIPDDVTAMIEFRQRVLSTPSTLNGPTVVHCSAGVGRTGTFIALDILTKEGEAEKAIDISGCVYKMRQNRPNMVQTIGQYQFLHTAVVYSLTFDCKQIKGENFNEYMNKHSTQVLNIQFKHLQQTLETRSKDETEAVERNKQHLSKNRANADIPGNENRPRLYLNLKPGASDYINAVYIHSYRMKKHYLVAQTPLPETVIDFLTIAVQERCSCIVSFEADMDKQKNIGLYYPAANQDVLKKGMFQVSCSREENKRFYAERTLIIKHTGTSTDRTIPHIQFTDWDEMENKPRSTTNFLSFLNVIDNVMKQQDDGPILVHCFDGAGKSGLFCVVLLLLHKMAVEHEVSVLNAVRKVKTTRRQAIPNQEQFVFCHGCVSEYLRSFDVYANFSDDTGQLYSAVLSAV